MSGKVHGNGEERLGPVIMHLRLASFQECDLSGVQVVNPSNNLDFARCFQFRQDRTVLANISHRLPHVLFNHLFNKLIVFRGAFLRFEPFTHSTAGLIFASKAVRFPSFAPSQAPFTAPHAV